ncbi:toprim domain-containing protein [Paraburkholderia sediminicola]|uniref:DUF7146 domain-containing protein n=1 Tax=Paraburkholderia sediminicola TaxID=458836 RepID=UPI0038B7E834
MISWTDYGLGSHRLTCPACGRGPRDKTLGLTIKRDWSGVCHCYRCGLAESYRPERGAHLSTPSKPRIKPAAPSEKHETLSDWGHSLWAVSKSLSGIALDYLNARRCCIPPADADLRWHPALKHPAGHAGPALVALITDALTGEPLSLHRTWIRADGRKSDIDPPRLLLGGHRKQGGVIRLWPAGAATPCLGIAEGIETALSLAWGVQPVLACIDAGNLAAFPVLPGIERLVIARDNDPAGIRAVGTCAQRWANAGRTVLVTQQQQNDLNDLVMGVTAA